MEYIGDRETPDGIKFEVWDEDPIDIEAIRQRDVSRRERKEKRRERRQKRYNKFINGVEKVRDFVCYHGPFALAGGVGGGITSTILTQGMDKPDYSNILVPENFASPADYRGLIVLGGIIAGAALAELIPIFGKKKKTTYKSL